MSATRRQSEELTSPFIDNLLGPVKIMDHMLVSKKTNDGRHRYSYVVKVIPEADAEATKSTSGSTSEKSVKNNKISKQSTKCLDRPNLHYQYFVQVKFIMAEPKKQPQTVFVEEFQSDCTLREVVTFFRSEHPKCSTQFAYCTGRLDASASLPITEADLDTQLTYFGDEGCEAEPLFIITMAK